VPVIAAQIFVPGKGQAGSAEYRRHSHAELQIFRGVEADFVAMQKRLGAETGSDQITRIDIRIQSLGRRRIVHPSLPRKPAQKPAHSCRTEQAGQNRKLKGRRAVDGKHRHRSRVIAHQQRTALARPQPQVLPAQGKLHIAKGETDGSLD